MSTRTISLNSPDNGASAYRTLTLVTIGTQNCPASEEDITNFKTAYLEAVANQKTLVTHHAWYALTINLDGGRTDHIETISVGTGARAASDEELEEFANDLKELLSTDATHVMYFTGFAVGHQTLVATTAVK